MTGKELYRAYVELQLDLNNCLVDDWPELEDCEQNVWNRLAENLNK